MTPHRILQLNALATTGCALGMLALRGTLHPLFGLATPRLLDGVAVFLLAYGGALALASRQERLDRPTLMAFTAGDVLWVCGSGIVLLLFWSELAAAARLLIIAVAIVVEVFATLQFRAARQAATG